jgi:ankyrin repeat protein
MGGSCWWAFGSNPRELSSCTCRCCILRRCECRYSSLKNKWHQSKLWRLAKRPPLVLAAEDGHSAVVGLLLALGNIDPNIGDTDNERPLHRAIKSGHTSPIRQLLARDDIDVNAVGDWGETPLLKAIMGNMEEVVDSLFARDDLDLNIVDRSGNHLLLYAAWFGLGLDKVKLILDRTNVNPDIVGAHGRSAFILACRAEHENLELIEFLVDRGINVNRRAGVSMLTGLCEAIFYGYSKVIKFLLNRDNVDPNLPDSHGDPPLTYAIWRQNLSAVDMLLQNDRINVNARNHAGSTALAYACGLIAPDHHTVDFVKLLLSHPDIDPNILDNNGVSPLSKVIELWSTGVTHYRESIAWLLLAAGAR